MRNTFWLFLILGCGPRGVVDGTADAGDADTDADSDADSDADTDTGLPGIDCDFDPGPWDIHPLTEAGITVSTSPPATSGGVAALAAATVDTIDAVVDVDVTSAIVTSIDYVPDNPTMNTATFWFEDADAAMMAWILDIGMDPNLLAPGDEISFTATLVTDYFGILEVTEATNFQIVSSGNPVHVVDGMASPLTTDDAMRTGEVWGEIVGTQSDCSSGDTCFDMDVAGDTLTFRTDSQFVDEGVCVHWIGPIGQYQGEVELVQSNYDWAFTY